MFVATKPVIVATKVCLSRQKPVIVATKYVCRDKTCDCRYESMFVATKPVIVATKVCLSQQKIVVVAAFANDNRQKLSVLFHLPFFFFFFLII